MNTKHTCGGVVYGRLAPAGTCPRCDELRAGSAPVQWVGGRRAQTDALRVAEIREHSCAKSKCGPVCTFGEW